MSAVAFFTFKLWTKIRNHIDSCRMSINFESFSMYSIVFHAWYSISKYTIWTPVHQINFTTVEVLPNEKSYLYIPGLLKLIQRQYSFWSFFVYPPWYWNCLFLYSYIIALRENLKNSPSLISKEYLCCHHNMNMQFVKNCDI